MKTQVNIWDEYKKLYENDPFVKYVDVARMAGVSRQRIDQIAKKDGWKKIVTRKEAIEKKIIDYVNEINAKGIFETMEDIVKNVGLYYRDVRLTFKKYKLYVSTENPNWAKNRKPINQSKFEMFKNFKNMGLSLKDISERIDIKYGTLLGWNNKYISKRVKAEPIVPRQKDLAFEKFKELNAQGYCAKDIADRVGYTRGRIYKWRKLLQQNNSIE